jgi:peptidoglycan/xylan/chitin deacetylase (PgdA/CDA1 family)
LANDKIESHAIILQYHRFDESKYPSTDISMDLFKKQIEYLAKNNYNVMPLSTIVNYLSRKKELPPKTVAITMDDAYESVYTKAYPLLKKYKFPFTVFVNSSPIVHHSKNFASWEDMKEMGANGAEFANHTYTHQYLVRMDANNSKNYEKDVTKEIEKSETQLEENLGKYVCTNPKMLAYPFGEFDARLMRLLEKLAYVGIAQNSGPVSSDSDLLALHRFPMSGGFGKMEKFILKLHTLPLPLRETSNEDTIVDESNNPPLFSIMLKKELKDLQCFTSNGEKIKMNWLSKKHVQMQSNSLLKYPRDHYTCTAMASKGRWYWYSHMWVVLQDK